MNTAAIYNNVPTPICSQTPLSVATPDGGILYTGFKCINYIAAPAQNENDADEVKTMSTRITVSALDVSPLWGRKQHSESSNASSKQFAIVAEDLSVQVWDCDLGESIMGHKAHQHQHEARDVRMYPMIKVLMGYICNGNILSMDANDLVIYCVASNTYCRRPTFISARNHQLTVLRCSPYNENLFALGTSSGFVMVCDMRKMNIVYKFTCQQSSICGLAWREMTFPREQLTSSDQWRSTLAAPIVEKVSNDCDDFVGLEKPTAKEALEFEEACKGMKANPSAKQSKTKKQTGKAPLCKSKAAESDDIFDIYNTDHLECEFGAPARQSAKKSSQYSDDFVGLEKPIDNAQLDFMEACRNMKAEIKAHREHASDEPQVEVTLADCQESGVRGPRSESTISQKGDNSDTVISESSEGSLEVIQFSSSSDDAVIVDGEAAKPKREVLHHIYHQAEVHETPKSLEVLKTQTKPQPSNKFVKDATIDTITVASAESAPRPDILLVSINDNDIIMIWNTLTGAHCGKTYSKGNNAASKAKEVHWLNDNIIVSLCRQQLVYWTLDFEPKQQRYKLHKDHVNKSSVQDIVTIAPIANSNSIWMSMRNRRVGILNPKTGLLSAVYGTLAFGVRAIAECPDDLNKIALGCSDKRVALFDLSKIRSQYAPIDSVNVNSIVYSLAWSPDCLQLAFGTYDGGVGIIDVDSMRVKTTFRNVYKKEVYSLMWQDNYIYFIVNRVLGVYTANQPKKDAIIFTNIERPSYLCVRDAFLFVGTEDGFLQLYERKPDAELAYTSVRQAALLSRYITDISFNPLQRNQFVVVGHDKFLHIMEFQPEQRGWTKQLSLTASDPKASITSVKWSNMDPHLLLSFHIEGKVCLWNLKELSEPPLTISYHCPMWCGMFLPTDESVIMSGGKALSLELISIKDALAKNEKNICCKSDALLKVKWASKSMTQPQGASLNASQKKRLRREKRKAENQLHPAPEEQPTKEAEMKSEKVLSDTMQMLSLSTKSTSTQATQIERSKAKELESQAYPDNFMAHSRTCLCLTQKELNKYALEKLAVVLTEDAAKIDKSVLMSKLFSTKVMAKDLIATELNNLKQSNNKDIAPLCLTVSTFKVRDELQQHIENKTLNEWHLSLAPAVSYVFWQKCCKAYASQMEEKGFIVHAATYLGAVDMQTEAINLLLKHEYFKEALAHARIHLPATDPMIKTIINNWLEQLEKTGNFAAAALICVLDNEMLRGFSYLRKFRNCTPEIADLMEQIKRIGQLGSLFEDSCMDRAENAAEKELKEEAN
ncbi:LOW QUALITY PROTEIN: protein rigor mortis [Drosophila nasuta]|uniref:LOW QUALITY PROTEIN: protein rigor mortis n=1 Tax=Drosophila nasuta TaxID=42062 RepID=UPI00295ED89D|nr:LOW QUALITY PROTEIN: protein rigor mortis [Drosophila nasuta]